MSAKQIEEEIAGLRRELDGLKSVTTLPSAPLHPHTLAIALAKIAKLQSQIEELEEKLKEHRCKGGANVHGR